MIGVKVLYLYTTISSAESEREALEFRHVSSDSRENRTASRKRSMVLGVFHELTGLDFPTVFTPTGYGTLIHKGGWV